MTTQAPPKHSRDWSIQIKLPAAQSQAVFRDVFSGLQELELAGPHPNLILCALPKSGSLHTAALLSASLGLRNHQIGFQGKGGTLYYPRLLLAKFLGQGTLSHCHQAATPDALQIVRRLHLRPVVLLRDIPDALVSRRDMLLRDRWCANLIAPLARERFFALDRERQLDVVLDLFAPDFLGFSLGWLALRGTDFRPVFARYEDLVADEVGFVLRIAAELELPCDAGRVREVAQEIRAEGGINFSTGEIGRGRKEFSPAQLERLARLAWTLGAENPALLGLPAGRA